MVGYSDSGALGIFAICDPESVSKLGDGLGKNSHLAELTIQGSRGLNAKPLPINEDPFCEGFELNSSIERLTMKSLSGQQTIRVVGEYAGSNLKYLTMINCDVENWLSDLQGCKHLK